MKISNLRIGTRLWLAVGLFVGAMVLLIAFAAVRSAQSQASADHLLGQAETKMRLAARWASLTEVAVTRLQASAISADANVYKTFKPLNDRAIAEINELQKQLNAFGQSDDERKLLELIAARRQAVLASNGRVFKAKEADDAATALREATEVFGPAAASYMQAQRDYVRLHEAEGARVRAVVADDRRATVAVAAVAVAFIIVGVLVGATALVRSIRRPLAEAVAMADAIAAGDLSSSVRSERADEIGDLMRAQHAMLEALRAAICEVRATSDSVRTASGEIASGNQDLSARTEQAAASLQQTASSMTQLTTTVRQSADSARQANQLVAGAAHVASRGGEVVSQVVTTMDEIHASSRRIADIIGVIDGIAFQTNILALNAAVEAARAGEQGRGFAVVASEVRTLAQRSAEAAREIKSLIGSSVERVEAGSRLVGDAGRTMQEIVGSVNRVRDIIAEISAAASEQSNGIGHVGDAVAQLDHMTQQNAALVEQSAAAATSLREQAQRLNSVIEVFRLEARA